MAPARLSALTAATAEPPVASIGIEDEEVALDFVARDLEVVVDRLRACRGRGRARCGRRGPRG